MKVLKLSNKCECWVKETKLDTQIFGPPRPIEVSESQWYAKFDGRETLKDIYRELKKFKNCQMFRSDSERVYFTFEYDQVGCRIEFPDSFPKSWAKLQFHKSLISLDDCVDGQSISKRIEHELKRPR